ncbi:MAG: transcription termination/antitermination factor NusG [Muribaculaceae bacterium]|nr:transcription termination/antitermination factor NusG [Muribaculaceae bacterium]
MAEGKKQWYVLRTISGKELKVKEMLEAACKNNPDDLGRNISQVLVPTEKVYTMRAGKKVLKEKVQFSGYVYVEAVLHGDIENFLQNTTNVIDFLRSREQGKKPVAVPESQIAAMLGTTQEREDEHIDVLNDYLEGESVKVTDGPFNGFIGEIKEVNRERRELTVMVKVFGRETPLKLDNSQVERV